MKKTEKMLRYSNLDVAEKPKLLDNDDSTIKTARIHFMKRVYDAYPYSQLVRSKYQSMNMMPLCTNVHTKTMKLGHWQHLQELVGEGSDQDLKIYVSDMLQHLGQVRNNLMIVLMYLLSTY